MKIILTCIIFVCAVVISLIILSFYIEYYKLVEASINWGSCFISVLNFIYVIIIFKKQ